MGKFKEFLIKENIGLGDLGMRIDQMAQNQDLDHQIKGAMLSSYWSDLDLPVADRSTRDSIPELSSDLGIPNVERTGKITHLMLKRNPIYVRLSDGTECHFSYDEYKRIQGEPAIGKTMTVIFQRHPSDNTPQHSRIEKIIVRE